MSNLEHNDDLWESGQLGCSEEHARVVSAEESAQIDAAIGLEPTELRLAVELVAAFKTLARQDGIGYKPLMRHALARYAETRLRPSHPPQGLEGMPPNCS